MFNEEEEEKEKEDEKKKMKHYFRYGRLVEHSSEQQLVFDLGFKVFGF